MTNNYNRQEYLTKNNKTAIGVLSIGTFLEYFDLMLYVHMAVLLNEIFFPKTDPSVKSLITATVFCSTFIFRPFGALVFGWIGDNLGRKSSLIIATMMMSFCCLIMAILPTYAEIGIAASILVTLCRIIQGMSSMGEIIGAQIYLTEVIKVPARYAAVAFIPIASSLGGVGALGVASLVLTNESNNAWRYAFLIGSFIACIGFFARKALKETREFIDAKKRHNTILSQAGFEETSRPYQIISQMKTDKKTIISLFASSCMFPVCFYFSYFYCGEILQNNFGYTPKEVIKNNFIVSIVQMSNHFIFLAMVFYIHPLQMVRIRIMILSILFLLFPLWVQIASSGTHILILQCMIILFSPAAGNAASTIYNHLVTLKRFTYATFLYAVSRASIYVITSYGFLKIKTIMGDKGDWGISIFSLLILLFGAYAINNFIKLEKANGAPYPWIKRIREEEKPKSDLSTVL